MFTGSRTESPIGLFIGNLLLTSAIPGIAEVNKRLPIDNPMGLSVLDPVNICYYTIFTAIIGTTILIQWYFLWKKKSKS